MKAKISYCKRAIETDMEPSLRKLTAKVQIQPESGYMEAQTFANVVKVTDQEIEFILAVEFSDSPGKFVIKEISQSGQPCRLRLGRDRVFLTPVQPADQAEIKFVYTGKPRQD